MPVHSSLPASFSGAQWLHTLGIFHPVVVHFPIVLLLLAAFLEALEILQSIRQKKSQLASTSQLDFAIGLNLGLGAVAAVVAAALGWADAATMGFSSDLRSVLAWHRWLGTGAAIGALFTFWVWWRFKVKNPTPSHRLIYRLLLAAVVLSIATAGHWGAMLVYGWDYFSWSK